MRFIPFVSALLVIGLLYLVLLERPALVTFAQGEGLGQAIAVATGEAEPSEAVQARLADPAAEEPASESDPETAAAEPVQAEAGPQAVRVVARHSEARIVDTAVRLRGQTEADRTVTLLAETASTVISAPLPRGSLVEAGQLLCDLDPGTRETSLAEARARLTEAEASRPTSAASLAEAEALLEEAQINLTAAEKLSEGGFASTTTLAARRAAVRAAEAAVAGAQAGLTSAEASIQSAQAGIASAEKEIERLQIHAPFAGILEDDTAELGSFLTLGGQCATVIALDPIRLTGYLPETEVERVELGAMASARLAATGGEVAGKVTFLSRSADPTTRTFKVEVTVPNPDLRIREGQTAAIAIEAEGLPAHFLPQSALTLNDEGTLGVRLVGAGKLAEFAPVTVLRDEVRGIWLTGLPEAVDVITIGQDYVIEGVPVEPTFENPLEATQ
ncbi:efflux RND transporter periplasmic adaptor subunit [Oceanicola sp. S124]|uniref:efflux RND transporter periplasmic adaptor subunit n=1 Tax=Oceanicola sp. S124 TaxID=1042378 RepID=UPI0002F35D70|nr:efflux RND transporter periplasmic adaptor subunit [Oceanicola sp. S124]